MTIGEIIRQLADGAILKEPHWTEPVKVLAVKSRASSVEVQAVGLRTKRLWNKLLKAEAQSAARMGREDDGLA